jgi:aspartate kinase
VIKGITAIRDLTMITVSGRGMQGVPGVAGRVFSAVAHSGASVLLITQSSSEQGICFIVRAVDADAAIRGLNNELELERARGVIENVARADDVAIIAVVGAGMLGRPGIAWRVFGALAEKDINVISIAQGSSEYNLSLVLALRDADEGVRAIHKQFALHQIS